MTILIKKKKGKKRSIFSHVARRRFTSHFYTNLSICCLLPECLTTGRFVFNNEKVGAIVERDTQWLPDRLIIDSNFRLRPIKSRAAARLNSFLRVNFVSMNFERQRKDAWLLTIFKSTSEHSPNSRRILSLFAIRIYSHAWSLFSAYKYIIRQFKIYYSKYVVKCNTRSRKY